MGALHSFSHLLRSEAQLEWRRRGALAGLALQAAGTVLVIYLAFRGKTTMLGPVTWNALLWIALSLLAVVAVGRSFTQEAEGRHQYRYQLAPAELWLLAKLTHNALVMLALTALTTGLLYLLLPVEVGSPGLLVLTLALGAIGLASLFTLPAALGAKAGGNPVLIAVLSLPVQVPLLLLVVRLSGQAIDGLAWNLARGELLTLGGLVFIAAALSTLLFAFVWRS